MQTEIASSTRPRAGSSSEVNSDDEISIFRLLTPLVRQWRTVIAWTLSCGVAAVIITFVLRQEYTASASFRPDSADGPLASSVAGLAGQLGLALNASGSGPNSDFYVALLSGKGIARELLSLRFVESGDRSPDSLAGRQLIDIWGVDGISEADRWERAIKKLRKALTATVDRKAGIVNVTMIDTDPERAAAIANTALELLNKYNVEQRQSQSRQQRQFVEARLAEARVELSAAEERQLEFLTSNRTYAQSPVLSSHLAQLQRVVQQKQEVVLTLTKAYEEARVAEVRDLPVLSVVDRAEPPARRSFPVRWKFLLVGLIIGTGLGIAAAVVKEVSRTLAAEARGDYLEFRTALRAARDQVRSLARGSA